MRLAPLILLAFLAACAPQQGALTAPALGLTGTFSEQVVISDHPHHVLMGHVIQARRDGLQTHALVIGQRRDGVHRLRMSEAWSGGIALPFSPTHRRLDGCTHGHCRDNSVGMILLSEPLLTQSQTHGLTARLIGPSGAVDITVPASLFQTLPE